MNNLYWHRSINFGDMISPYLLTKLKGDAIYSEPDSEDHKYVLTGSILSVNIKNATIFGAGFVSEDEKFIGENVTVKAVRGVWSLDKISKQVDISNILLGDPGLLLPYYYKPNVIKKYKLGITPHIMDYERTKDSSKQVIDLRMGENETISEAVERVIYQINECESILSSSLHGLVVATAYGIPATYFYSDSLVGDGFKFKDFLETEVNVQKLYECFNTL